MQLRNNNNSRINNINSRPISAAFRHPYTSSRPKETIPPIINTMPNNPKLVKNIGLNIDKEQLNESNVQNAKVFLILFVKHLVIILHIYAIYVLIQIF